MKLDFEQSVSSTTAIEDIGFSTEASERQDYSFSGDARSSKLQAGVKAARAGNRAEARLLLLEAADAEPESEEAWLYLASVSEYPEELLIFLGNALRINPENEQARERFRATERLLAENLIERGAAALAASQTDFARQCFRQAAALDEESEAAWLGLARAADSVEEKTAFFERVLECNPANETALNALAADVQTIERNLAKAAAEAFAGDYAAAEDTLNEVFSLAPDAEEAWLLKVFLSASLDEKNECWETVLRINPKNELARAGTDFMRSLKAKLVSPLEREIQTRIDESADKATEDKFAEEKTVSATERGDAANFDDAEVYEIAVDEADLPDYFEADAATEDFSLNFEAKSPALEETKDTQPEIAAENPPPEERNFSARDEQSEVEEEAAAAHKIACPFCSRENEPLVFVCPSCMAVLMLSDLEMLLAHQDANREIVRQAVERMEAEKDFADFGADELKCLGIGRINLKHYRQGFAYLQEAVQINPNDVVFGAQVNALAIRLAEIEEQADAHSSASKNKTILVVDDSATVRKLISGKLEKSGHAVLCAVDGMDALEKIEELVPDLILLDINMPRMDGYTVCKMIRTNEKTKDIPVVMISGKDGFFDKVRGRMAGTTGYITKPFGPETLMKTVENYIV